MGIDLSIPVIGAYTVDMTKNSYHQQHSASVNANFSIKGDNGSIGSVSSNPELTIALGGARMGAKAWMLAGGDVEKYNNTRAAYMSIMKAGKAAAALSLNTPLMAFYSAQMVNFDKGAATAKGFGLNEATDSNLATANRAIAKKATNGDLVNSKNEQLSPSLGSGTLQGKGYAQAQQERRVATPSVAIR